jgi:hypothetical protein
MTEIGFVQSTLAQLSGTAEIDGEKSSAERLGFNRHLQLGLPAA